MNNSCVPKLGIPHGVSSAGIVATPHPPKRYLIIDVFRLLCACLVVMIHCLEVPEGHPFAHMIVVCFSQQAVPFFFLVSGFFLGKKLYASPEPLHIITRYVKSQLLLYGAWMLIEFPSMLCNYLTLYADRSRLFLIAVMIRRILFAGQGVYWYLLALAKSAFIAGLCIRCRRERLLYVIAVIGLFLGFAYDAGFTCLFFGKLNQLFYGVFSWSNNFLMKGLPYVALGTYFARHERRLPCHGLHLPAAYISVSLISIVLFCCLNKSGMQLARYMFFYPIQAALLFLMALRFDPASANAKVGDTLREISSTLYFLHTIFIYRIVDVLWSVNAPILLKFSISVCLSLMIYWIAKRTKFKPLCWLLSIKA